MRDFVTIEAKKIGSDVWYRAVRVITESPCARFQPLVYVEDDPQWFLTYVEADAVKQRYESLADNDDWLSARWDYHAVKWDIAESVPRPDGHRGEDFHADDGL